MKFASNHYDISSSFPRAMLPSCARKEAHDFPCPACHVEAALSCVIRGFSGESFPHKSRVMLAENANRLADEANRRSRTIHEASGWRRKRAPDSAEEIAERLLDVLCLERYPCDRANALALWKRRTHLFEPGDPLILQWNNGSGTRGGVISWSSKKKCVVGPVYARFATYRGRNQNMDVEIVENVRDSEQFVEREEGSNQSDSRLLPVFRAFVIRAFSTAMGERFRKPVAPR